MNSHSQRDEASQCYLISEQHLQAKVPVDPVDVVGWRRCHSVRSCVYSYVTVS